MVGHRPLTVVIEIHEIDIETGGFGHEVGGGRESERGSAARCDGRVCAEESVPSADWVCVVKLDVRVVSVVTTGSTVMDAAASGAAADAILSCVTGIRTSSR